MKRFINLPLWRAGAMAALALASLLGGTAATATPVATPGTIAPTNSFTPASTSIGNKATLTYTVGGQNQNPIGSSDTGNTTGPGTATTFLVDNYVRHLVTARDSAIITGLPGQLITATFTISNTGNNTQDYKITVADVGGSQSAYGTSYTTAFNVYLGGTCKIWSDGVQQDWVANLRPDYSADVQVACTMPATQPNGDVAVFSVTAQARDAGLGAGSGGVLSTATNNGLAGLDVVFADGQGTDDGLRDGLYSVHGAFQVSNATLSVQKVVAAVCNEFAVGASSAAIPGAYVQYTVSITNSGSTTATLTAMTDALSTSLDYDTNLIKPVAAADCVNTGPVWSAGNNFKVDVVGTALFPTARTGFPKFFKADAADTNSDGARLDLAAGVQTLSMDLKKALAAQGTYADGELRKNETVQLIYQVKIR
jgi:uncharacterized repeat protein (TIGR01451 family)